ncbi:VUT family protein [Brevibacillus humidisoli]|uniref:VUT family protein n=1 Tax=Brevibacillus humidisoli TaxID=2895522 RepID=UPI001E4E518E|nr:VUT family protein [Brevibacillus humidisoli]UFJ39272.1 VUT family protein [Brevibacillus humidisoli]
MRIILYLLVIIAANIITAAFPPIQLWWFLVPTGSFLIGATFILRDLVQMRYGKKTTYLAIGIALLTSALSSYLLGDPLVVTFASAVSFIVSEATDTEIYSRLKRSLAKRLFWSGTIGGSLDSVIFVILGISPIGAGFIPWEAVPLAVAGQVLVKVLMQGFGAVVLSQWGAIRIQENIK